MELLPKRDILKRRGLTFFVARIISNWGYRSLTHAHVEFTDDLIALKNRGSAFLYTGFHRSLWETSGMLSALDKSGLPIPVVGMGDNLIKGKLFVTLAKNTSIFLVKRGKSRREIVESAKELKSNMYSFMAYGKDVLLFPEGTRTSIPRTGEYGGFFPTAFDALLEYEKSKDTIDQNIKGVEKVDTYIIPFNCDYSVIREARELVDFDSDKPRTLKVLDSLKMLKHIKDVYISFGSPVKVSENLEKSRKDIAILMREKCLDLVKILPVNIVSTAFLDAVNENKGDLTSIYKKIQSVLDKLKGHTEKFRGFEKDNTPEEIYHIVSRSNPNFRVISKAKFHLYKLYADYIGHYFS
ncbi:MAG: 1-acyl-sn-glycerol-3-phosphate acyltransferase [Candidatus Aminicenantes bacterium]|nr:1-acyl-sn-glycerol-3-phosphate acyltransferase [Candidatus Aminicenantes bacterium]